MESRNKDVIRVRKMAPGIEVADARVSEGFSVTSKNRCILGFIAGGRQILMSTRDLLRDYENGDGTEIRIDAIKSYERVYTFYSRDCKMATAN